MATKDKAKRVLGAVAFEGLLEALKGAILKFIENVTPRHLYDAIKEDRNLWEKSPRTLKKRGERWVHKMRRYKHRVTPELILDWIAEDRNDLASLIINMGPEGKRWFVKQVESIKEQLWPNERPNKSLKLGLMPTEEEDEEEQETEPEQPEAPKASIRYG